jgi:hypothetical protein
MLPDEPRDLAAIGDRFEIALLEERTRDRPDDALALRHLAYAYSTAGRWPEALAADLRLVAMAPEVAEFHYDLACSQARTGGRDEAFASLERAVELGFRRGDLMLADPDLETLHEDPRWAPLLARAPDRGEDDDDDEEGEEDDDDLLLPEFEEDLGE